MAALVSWLPLLLRRRKRERALAAAATWPVVEGKLLTSKVVEKDPLAEGGTAFQDRQIESAFYFTLQGNSRGSYFGGFLRTASLSDSEAFRFLARLPEDTPVHIRYNPANPDEAHVFPADNPAFPIALWPN